MLTLQKNFKIGAMMFGIVSCLFACNSTENQAPTDITEEIAPTTDGYAKPYFALPSSVGDIQQSDEQPFVIDTVMQGLENPWAMEFLPNGQVLVTELSGKLLLVENGQVLSEVAGVPEVMAENQGGLLDVALHPDYPNNGWIYLSYSSPGEGGANTALMRAKLEGNALVEQEKLFQALPYSQKPYVHFGSRIVFDPDGYLFLSVGERGNSTNAQTITDGNTAGNILRLHDDGRIPSDNPFVGQEGKSAAVYSYGHRNPQGMVYSPIDNVIWEHEHGPKGGDELNILTAGRNYGWPEITYGINYDGTIITEETAREGMEQPIHYWVPSIAPCGMALVTSDRYPNWYNNLLIGSLKFRYVARCAIKDKQVSKEEELMRPIGRIRAIEQAPDGYIYIAMESPGQIVRLLPVSE